MIPWSCIISAELAQPVSPCMLCRVGEGRAYWSLGNAHTALGNHQQAMYFAEKHLEIAKEVPVYIFTSSLRRKVITTFDQHRLLLVAWRITGNISLLFDAAFLSAYNVLNLLCCCSHRPETKVQRWQQGWTCQICGWLWGSSPMQISTQIFFAVLVKTALLWQQVSRFTPISQVNLHSSETFL